MGRALDQRADARQHPPPGPRHPLAQQVDLARSSAAPGRAACARSSSCRSRWRRGTRRRHRPHVEVDAVDRAQAAETLDQAASADDVGHPVLLPGSAAAASASASRVTVPVSDVGALPGGSRTAAPSGPAVIRAPARPRWRPGRRAAPDQLERRAPGHRSDGEQGDAAAVEADRRGRAVERPPGQAGQVGRAGRAGRSAPGPRAGRGRGPGQPRAGRRANRVTPASGTVRSRSRNRVSSAARSRPSPKSRTCSGSPLSASIQMSTRSTDAASSDGVTRSPRPRGRPRARHRSGSARRRRPRTGAGDPASSAAGRAGSAPPAGRAARVARRASYSHTQVPPRRPVPVSPPALTTSTRLSAAPRHQTRIWVRSLNRSTTREKARSPTGSTRPPADSAYPENRGRHSPGRWPAGLRPRRRRPRPGAGRSAGAARRAARRARPRRPSAAPSHDRPRARLTVRRAGRAAVPAAPHRRLTGRRSVERDQETADGEDQHDRGHEERSGRLREIAFRGTPSAK